MGRINVSPKKAGNEFQAGPRHVPPTFRLEEHNIYCPHSICDKNKFHGYNTAGEYVRKMDIISWYYL